MESKYYSLQNNKPYISRIGDYVAGIGYGEDRLAASQGEALERYSLMRGPSQNVLLYSSKEPAYEKFIDIKNKYNEIYDSGGSALYPNVEESVKRALFEFFERQSLVFSWQYGYPGMKLVEGTLESGIGFETYDISIFKNITVCISFLVSKYRDVSYAVGASAHEEYDKALDKSLGELEQSVLLMQDNIQRRKFKFPLLDDIQENYYKYNFKDSVRLWGSGDNFFPEKFCCDLSKFDVEKYIEKCDLEKYLFVDKVFYLGDLFYHTRILSPEWFLGFRDMRVLERFSHLHRVNESPVPFG